MIALATLIGAFGFLWPFFTDQSNGWFLYVSAPIALALIAYSLHRKKLDARAIALLAVLSALMAALRPLGAGALGIEPMWFLLIIAASVYGATFGFILGITGVLTSALLTAGFGPWLAYQAFAAAWIGLLAAFIPRRWSLVSAIIGSMLFGVLMDLQFWPFTFGSTTQLSYLPGASVSENLHRFLTYHFATSMAWDIPRAITTATLIVIAGGAVTNALERVKRPVVFTGPVQDGMEGQ